MKKQFLTVCMHGDEILYSLYSYNGHISRVYPSGKIGRANEEDKRAGELAAKWLHKFDRE